MAEATPTSNLAPMFGDYVSNYLGQAQALGGTGFQPYTGDRYAGPSSLQQQAFSGIGGLAMPGHFNQAGDAYQSAMSAAGGSYAPTSFSSFNYSPTQMSGQGGISALQIGPGLDASNASTMQSFMNPYTQQVTDIGKREAQRAYDIGVAGRDASAAKAGAFGGSRHGLVESEALRDLNTQKNDIQMKGDNAAYGAAMEALNQQRASQLQGSMANQSAGLRAGEFNANMGYNTGVQNMNALNRAGEFNSTQNMEAQRQAEMSRQFGANFGNQQAQTLSGIASGLSNLGTSQLNAQQGMLGQQLSAGNTQQGINQQPLDFGYEQWQQSLQYPYQQLQFQQSMLQGLPLSVQSQPQSNALLEGLMGAGGIYNLLFGG